VNNVAARKNPSLASCFVVNSYAPKSLRNTDGFSEFLKYSIDCNVFGVELSTVYVSERVQIPAARYSEVWKIFFGLKEFAKMRGFGGSTVRRVFATESLRVAGIFRAFFMVVKKVTDARNCALELPEAFTPLGHPKKPLTRGG
jgi:hypothetical protein